ncbi:hypothetical protein BN871_GE_00190 [Paenibacillus sp. P22]|nr:hypothetical protein BN871_GE_00190 [Paenibacillus sp. P22]
MRRIWTAKSFHLPRLVHISCRPPYQARRGVQELEPNDRRRPAPAVLLVLLYHIAPHRTCLSGPLHLIKLAPGLPSAGGEIR